MRRTAVRERRKDVRADLPDVLTGKLSDGIALTMLDLRRDLAAEDAAKAVAGETQVHEVSASQFLMTGIELEGQQ